MKKRLGWIVLGLGVICLLSVGLLLQYLPILSYEVAGKIEPKPYDLYTWKENLIIAIPCLFGFVGIIGGMITTVAYWE
jgi:hypothetical protein